MGCSYLTSILCCCCFEPSAICHPSTLSLSFSHSFFIFSFSLSGHSLLCSVPPHTQNGGQRWGSNSEQICGAAGPLRAQQLPRGPRGALSQLYMQMSLHLGNSVGMLGLGAYLCKSQGDSHSTTQSRPQTLVAISPRQHNNYLEKRGKHERFGPSVKRGREEWQSQGDWGNMELMVNKMYGCCR